ncbi:MAG: TMEM175 family protein, partial [Sphingomicrobium sp.]
MKPERLNAFTDGVLAIVITIMVLELHVPQGDTLAALQPALPLLAAYILSFANIGIFWSNHHHMWNAVKRIDGRVLLANLLLLFFLSIVPFVIRWIGEAGLTRLPVAAYGLVLVGASLSYVLLQSSLIAIEGADGPVKTAIG